MVSFRRSSLLLALAPASVLLAAAPPARTLVAAEDETTKPGRPPGAKGKNLHASDDLELRAEAIERSGDGHVVAEGPVELRMGDMRILADAADLYEKRQPDGTLERRVVAEGNVVFIRGTERLAGDRLEMDGVGRGFLSDATGYLEPGVFVTARRIERVDDDTYRVEGGEFTPCAQPNPRWAFTASGATIDLDLWIRARNALFKRKGVPALYTPYIAYPIAKHGRATGFLLPHFGGSLSRGFQIGTGFFWAMGRSADQTLSVDWYSKVGYGLGHEFRWAGTSPSRGLLRSYLVPSAAQDGPHYDLDWKLLQRLPAGTRATLEVHESSLEFRQRFEDSFARAADPTRCRSATLAWDLGVARLSVFAERKRTREGDAEQTTGRLPALVLQRISRSVGWGGIVFGLRASAERLQRGNPERVDSWLRLDVKPTLSRPLRLSFLELYPLLGYRCTHYGASLAEDDAGESALVGPSAARSHVEASLEARGPTFARIFETPGFGYSERFKHTIGPVATLTYRSRVARQPEIAKSPYGDDQQQPGTQQILYGLEQGLYVRRPGAGGTLQTHELLLWRLTQTYYVEIGDGQNNLDPAYLSSFREQAEPEHRGPISSRLRLRPTAGLSLIHHLEYDVNDKRVDSMSASLRVARPRVRFGAEWSRSFRPASAQDTTATTEEDLQADVGVELVAKRLFVDGSVAYDLAGRRLHDVNGQVRYSVQCCGFTIGYARQNLAGEPDMRRGAWIELAHIGSFGGFLPFGRDDP